MVVKKEERGRRGEDFVEGGGRYLVFVNESYEGAEEGIWRGCLGLSELSGEFIEILLHRLHVQFEVCELRGALGEEFLQLVLEAITWIIRGKRYFGFHQLETLLELSHGGLQIWNGD